jgi:pimeloyl-ACP methyl ester carboxylesterase
VLGADPAQRDTAVSRELGERIAAAHAGVDYVVAEGSGHSVHRSDPARVVAEALAVAGRAR